MPSYPEVNKDKSRVFFLFPFALPDKSPASMQGAMNVVLDTRLSDLVRLPFMPQAVLKALESGDVTSDDEKVREKAQKKAEKLPALLQSKVWCTSTARPSKDLHFHLRKLLGVVEAGEANDDGSNGFHAHAMLELSPEAVNILTGRWQTRGPGLDVALPKSARRRLGLPEEQDLTIGTLVEAGYLQFFKTGIGVLILECSFHHAMEGPSSAEVILETNYRISHMEQAGGSGLTWARNAYSREGDPEIVPPLKDLAHNLLTCRALADDARLAPMLEKIRWPEENRIFTYSVIQFVKPFSDTEARRQYAYRLCNTYTSDYKVHEERIRATLVSAFDNVIHGSSIEGGCILVEEDQQVDFLKTYNSKVVRQVYLPLALISLHEFRHLLRLAQESALYVPRDNVSEHQLDKLRQIRHDLTNFRLYFRFSHASMISSHNLVHELWRKAFDLDRMLTEVSSDVDTAEKLLSQKAKDEEQRRWRVWSTVASSFAAFFALSQLIDIWVKRPIIDSTLQLTSLKVFNHLASVANFETVQMQMHQIETLLQSFAVIIAALTAIFVYKRKPKE